MEYKFKTIFEGKLVPCFTSMIDNLVFVGTLDCHMPVGRYKNVGLIEKGLPFLPIFEYTGVNDKNGEEIYRGHIVKTGLFKFPATVVWSSKHAAYLLEFEHAKDNEGRYQPFGAKFCRPEDLEIIGHIALREEI